MNMAVYAESRNTYPSRRKRGSNWQCKSSHYVHQVVQRRTNLQLLKVAKNANVGREARIFWGEEKLTNGNAEVFRGDVECKLSVAMSV